ncbi:CopG family transcriptional regulator [Haloarcula laminariae]|uniref:CopG family transcriptional regulator n=1 Tax=Haloarcula laminariae TaxID=2961577 RepID=UPI0024053284|nr:CopG family transcriptional regulator [Halomicroarcula sp. FL173]
MVRKSLSVSISFPRWMDDKIAEQADKHGVNYSEYVREIIRDHHQTPFDRMDDPVVCRDENGEVTENVEGAA